MAGVTIRDHFSSCRKKLVKPIKLLRLLVWNPEDLDSGASTRRVLFPKVKQNPYSWQKASMNS